MTYKESMILLLFYIFHVHLKLRIRFSRKCYIWTYNLCALYSRYEHNLLKFGVLESCSEISSQSKGQRCQLPYQWRFAVLHLCQPWADAKSRRLFYGNDGYADYSRLQDVEPHDPDFTTSLGGGKLRHSTDAANRSDTLKVRLPRNTFRKS